MKTHRKKTAKRLEQYTHKPRKVKNCQQIGEARSREGLSPRATRENGPAKTLVANF